MNRQTVTLTFKHIMVTGSSGIIGYQGRIHPGRSANPSQGTHYRQFRDSNQPTMHVFGPGEENRVPGGNPEARGEHANSTHTWRRRESDLQLWRCDANVLATKP
ncbi:hypothetical protein QTP70_031813, partial [Hemibagrus guttatus]